MAARVRQNIVSLKTAGTTALWRTGRGQVAFRHSPGARLEVAGRN
jgi:hypothetical protein